VKLSPAHGTPVAFDGQRSRLIDNGSVYGYPIYQILIYFRFAVIRL